MVRAVVGHAFCTGIGQHQPSGLQQVAMVMVVQGLSVLCQDGGKRHHAAVRGGDAVQHTGDVSFGHSRPAQAHGGGVHLVADVAGLVYLGNFARLLFGAEADHCLDEVYRRMLSHHRGAQAGQVFQQEHVVIPVGRQEVYFPPLRQGLADHFFQLAERAAVRYTYLCGQFLDRRLRTHPDDVVHGHIVTEEIVLLGVGIEQTGISGVRMSEEIKERTVLTVFVGIVRIIGRRFVVAQQQDEPAAHFFPQGIASFLVC